jgi:hypothetical protein
VRRASTGMVCASWRGINQMVVGFLDCWLLLARRGWPVAVIAMEWREQNVNRDELPLEEQAFVEQLRGRPDDADIAVACLRVIEDVLARRLLVQLASGYVVPDWWAMAIAADILSNGAAAMGNLGVAATFEEDRKLALSSIETLAAAGLY